MLTDIRTNGRADKTATICSSYGEHNDGNNNLKQGIAPKSNYAAEYTRCRISATSRVTRLVAQLICTETVHGNYPGCMHDTNGAAPNVTSTLKRGTLIFEEKRYANLDFKA